LNKRKQPRRAPVNATDRALDEIYKEIPAIPSCDGSCWKSCGPIWVFEGEWDRVKRHAGSRRTTMRPEEMCPLLTPTHRCAVYSVRPYLCRLWGTVKELACPRPACVPERWLSDKEALEIHQLIMAIAGPGLDGPLYRSA
jgi:uncharacterized protein